MGYFLDGGFSSQRYNRNAVTSSQSVVERGCFKGGTSTATGRREIRNVNKAKESRRQFSTSVKGASPPPKQREQRKGGVLVFQGGQSAGWQKK